MSANIMKLKFQVNNFKKMVEDLKSYHWRETSMQYTNSYIDAIDTFINSAFAGKDDWSDQRGDIIKDFVGLFYTLIEKLQNKGYDNSLVEFMFDRLAIIEGNLQGYTSHAITELIKDETPSINNKLSAYEEALRHWYLVKAKQEKFITAKQVGEKYSPDLPGRAKNIQKEYLLIDKGEKPGNKNQLENIYDTFVDYPNIQKAIINDIDRKM